MRVIKTGDFYYCGNDALISIDGKQIRLCQEKITERDAEALRLDGFSVEDYSVSATNDLLARYGLDIDGDVIEDRYIYEGNVND